MSEQVTRAVGRLRLAGVTLQPGLNTQEFSEIEDRFGFKFGPEHRELLTMALPCGDRWVDWRNASPDDLRARLDWPIESVIFDVHNGGFWPLSWGDRPGDGKLAERRARQRLAMVPQLIPVYSHRYLVAGGEYSPSPVFSVYQTDVIYYGDNLLDYLAHEFKVHPLHPSDRRHVPFWSDLADGLGAVDL